MVCEKVLIVTEGKNLEQHKEDSPGGWGVVSNPGVSVGLIEKASSLKKMSNCFLQSKGLKWECMADSKDGWDESETWRLLDHVRLFEAIDFGFYWVK